jgi:alginate O-acetyltransferase complex protein AlgF
MDWRPANEYDRGGGGLMRLVTALALVIFVAMPVCAGTRSVYGPEVPGDAAFVRILNVVPGSSPLEPELGATVFDPLAYSEVSPYRAVTPDIYLFSVADKEQEIIPMSGRYYTVAVLPSAIVVLEDPAHTDPARAQLFLYNFSSLPRVDLATADGKTRVIAAVPSGSSGLAVVNAVAASLAVTSGGARVKAIGDLGLARGSSFSVFVLGGGSATVVVTVKARVQAE